MDRPPARPVMPEFTGRTGAGPRPTDPLPDLLEERIVFLGTPLDETSANDVIARLVHLEHRAPDRDISLYINAPGGSFHAMTAIHDTMRYLSCDVETVCLGQAGPVAAVLLAAGTPGKRCTLAHARMTLRQPALSEPVQGRAGDLAVLAGELTRMRARMEELLARHTGRTREQVSADITRDRILTAGEAVEYGLVDRIVPDRTARPAAPTGR
ncbi:ATP-dependent Clp protease proteolytic subunit [Streptomyces sp. NPDC085931]|uniref:ATP-dependent Clp protease proteolytic subunit n=1 Tax=Streptomyces sp. NPDC085931 TaxID=3365740 RepID=UPI0037D04D12